MDGIHTLDGGFSTQLTLHVGDIVDGDPLWSARFLVTAPQAVYQTHLDFLNAGAEIIITNSYQASITGFKEYLNLDKQASLNLIKKSAELAFSARDQFLRQNVSARKPLVAGSVGPYGASLHDGSEYSGDYSSKVTKEFLKDWHRPRMNALVESGVDYLAIETIPTVLEGEALIELLMEFPHQKAWLSFSCRDNQHTSRGEKFQEVARRCWALNDNQLVAIGVNCLNPKFVHNLFANINDGLSRKIPLIVYPNSGEQYRPETGWTDKDKCTQVATYVQDWLDLGVKYVGGCCRTSAKDVKEIRGEVKKWILKNQS